MRQTTRPALRASDLEIRKRAGKLLGELDPGYLAREQRKERRRALAQTIAKVQHGKDATTWGESIPNPFTAITEEGKKKLRAEGVEVTGC